MTQETDILDVAAELTEYANQKSLENWRMGLQTGEEPDVDENGVRYCLDCGDVIPPERIAVAIPSPVRCVSCQSVIESRRRRNMPSSGIISAMNRAVAEEDRYSKDALRTASESMREYRDHSEVPQDALVYL